MSVKYLSDPAPIPHPNALHNTFLRLTRDKKLKVVVIGNSVTAGAPDGEKKNPSFYVALEDWLKSNFPEAKIEVVPKIIYAIGPEVQLFRIEDRVVPEKPDLVLAEFCAANSAWGDKGNEVTDPATEGYVRRLRFLLPQTDCILMMGTFVTLIDAYKSGKFPHSVEYLHKVAAHYECAIADAQKEVANRVLAGEEWKTYMNDGIHPSVTGYEVYSRILIETVEAHWKLFQQSKRTAPINHAFPTQILSLEPWLFPKFVPAHFSETDGHFHIRENGNLKYLTSSIPDAKGHYAAPRGAKIMGILMRDAYAANGNLEIEHEGQWKRLSYKGEPHFTVHDDADNRIYRNFFKAYNLPLSLEKIHFRVSPTPEQENQHEVQIVGFFVIERPAQIDFSRPAAQTAS